jgi:16S rRNA processing protein RimM
MPNAVIPNTAPVDLIELGRITAAYGVKGWVKVQPHSAQAAVLLSAHRWWLTPPVSVAAQAAPIATPVARKVVQARPQGAAIVAQWEGVTNRDQAGAWRGWLVHAPRAEFPQLDEGEYYWVDLIGCAVYGHSDSGAERIGVVAEVLDNGAHAVLKVQRQGTTAPGSEPGLLLDADGRPADEVLVPFVHAHVERVDLTERRIDTDWPLDF